MAEYRQYTTLQGGQYSTIEYSRVQTVRLRETRTSVIWCFSTLWPRAYGQSNAKAVYLYQISSTLPVMAYYRLQYTVWSPRSICYGRALSAATLMNHAREEAFLKGHVIQKNEQKRNTKQWWQTIILINSSTGMDWFWFDLIWILT